MCWVLKSDCGEIRDTNEDNYLQIEDTEFKLFAVADGMGGHNAGDVASSVAVEILKDYSFDLNNIAESIVKAINFINGEILKKAKESVDRQGMGTTLTMAILSDKLYIGHVGDSRAYLLRDNELKQLTEDHSLVNRLLKTDRITAQEAREHPQSHVLLQALGIDKKVDIDVIEIEIKADDLFLLCTDGLNCMVEDGVIKSVLLEEMSLEEKAEKLVRIANEAGGHDNITVNIFTS